MPKCLNSPTSTKPKPSHSHHRSHSNLSLLLFYLAQDVVARASLDTSSRGPNVIYIRLPLDDMST